MIKQVLINFKKLHPDAKQPVYGTYHAAGFDIFSIEDVIIGPGETKVINTGIATEIPEGKFLALWDKGGMAANAVHRFAGVIDSDYRGEWKIILNNHKNEPYPIKKGDKIVQGIIQDYYKANFREVFELSDTVRGEGRFGSTGA